MKSLQHSESKDLATSQLLKKAGELAAKAISPQTQKAYLSDWKNFEKFCSANDLKTLPASPETLCMYLAEYSETRSPMTLERLVCAVGKVHEWNGQKSPAKDERVKLVISGIKRSSGKTRAKSLPITIQMLRSVVDKFGTSSIDTRNKAIILIGWFGALRRSEIVAINHSDLEYHDSGLLLTIRKSKTDQEGLGVKIAIPRIENSKYCPVLSLLRWTERSQKCEGAVFTSLGMEGKKWWVKDSERDRLSDRMISKIVKKCLTAAGYKGKCYSGHSLRRGLATESGRLGVPERFIMRHLRHSSIQMVREYIDEGNIWEENPLPAIAIEFT